jgi:pimeloyl-ACP methyl ester carboxylesterase
VGHSVASVPRQTHLAGRPVDGYDAPTLADDVGALINALDLGRVHIVGHDIGGWVAYALAVRHSASVRSAVVIECLLPGIEPDAPSPDVPMWHIGFHLVPGLAEVLVSGNERVYFGHFLTSGTARADTINDDEIAHYAQAYRGDARLRAAFEVYRALPQNIAFNTTSNSGGTVPLLLVGGEQCFGPSMAPLADHLRRHHGWTNIDTAIVKSARHYLPDESPDAVAELISRHASAH